ncbi:MAG: SPOR domain-containing protein [Halioglobus sp.]
MAQDFAKRKSAPGARKAPARGAQAQRHPGDGQRRGNGVRVYFAGVLTGAFLSLLGYLALLPKPPDPALEGAAPATPQEAEIPKPRFDFYTMLPAQKIEVGEGPDQVEPAAVVSKPPAPTAAPEPYYLQAGSFRNRDDAERRRAELLLLGLDPKIEGASSDNGQWFRVYLGPFDTHDAMTKARGLLANQNIETVLLKRSGP